MKKGGFPDKKSKPNPALDGNKQDNAQPDELKPEGKKETDSTKS
jgi:hypothetical protein